MKCLAVFLLSCWIGPLAFAVNPTFRQEWTSFRQNHPFHIQIVGLSAADENQHRLLLVTEPPPHVTLADLQRLDVHSQGEAEVQSHTVGYDGWVKDILIELPPMNEADLELLVDRIHQYLFGTSYKAAALPISENLPPGSFKRYNLDLHVPAEALGSLLLQDGNSSKRGAGSAFMGSVILALVVVFVVAVLAPAGFRMKIIAATVVAGVIAYAALSYSSRPAGRFMPIEGGPAKYLRSLLEDRTSGVFVSEEPGFVIWSVPRGESLSNYKIEARQFSLDSDLILGAIADQQQVAIVARERIVPIGILPPLRTETMMLLAAANTEELAQSYERNNLLAGKYDDTQNLDWAPIYLSPQLLDTEYGSLLNITDQLLKSWSEHGDVRYINFNYPAPAQWPFPEALSRHAKTSELTFNWNTKGAGYSVEDNGLEVFALNRTGALPVDYLALHDEQLQKAEEDGYAYFAGQNDPNLVRVVQYAAFFQICRRFGLTASAPQERPLPASPTLEAADTVMVELVRNLAAAKLEELSAHFKELARGNPDRAVQIEAALGDLHALQDDRDLLIRFLDQWKDEGKRILAASLAGNRNSALVPTEAMLKLQRADSDAERDRILETLPERDQMLLVVQILTKRLSKQARVLQMISSPPLKTIMLAYSGDVQRPDPGWIRTPSIVISHPEEELAETVGGHNLDAAISVFRKSDDVTPGQPKVTEEDGQRVILYNPHDARKIGNLVRMVGKADSDKTDGELASQLTDAMKTASDLKIGGADSLLSFSRDGRPNETRGLSDAMRPNALVQSGFEAGRLELDSDQRALSDLVASNGYAGIVIERLEESGKYLVFHNSTRRIFEAPDVASAQDAVLMCMRKATLDKLPIRFHLRGFDVDQGQGFADSLELKVPDSASLEITRILDERKINSSALKQILSRDYDFKSARVEEMRTVFHDATTTRLEASVTLPERSGARSPLRMIIRIVLDSIGLTEERLAAIKEKIDRFVSGLSQKAGALDFLSAAAALRRDMRRIHPGINVQMKISKEAKDLYIVDARPFANQQGFNGIPA